MAMAIAIVHGNPALEARNRRSMDSIAAIESVVMAENELKGSLAKIAASTGPKYRVARINSAYTTAGKGTLTKYDADLIDERNRIKQCNITIWSRPWLENGVEVTFECDGEEVMVRKYDA
uniref:Cystatin domain-containing protein n=1 Tax=Glossina pallidipes TaxID=7398 RepID=A0A1A9ZT11_GLOPL